MSVCLTLGTDDESMDVNMANATWHHVLSFTSGRVTWNGYHGDTSYTPEQLRVVAESIPVDWKEIPDLKSNLLKLADAGGCELW